MPEPTDFPGAWMVEHADVPTHLTLTQWRQQRAANQRAARQDAREARRAQAAPASAPSSASDVGPRGPSSGRCVMADREARNPRRTPAGQRVEQARYRIADGTRALYAQRIAGRVAVVDVPIDFPGRVFLVERHVESLADLQSLNAAYVEHSTAPAARP